MLSPLAPAPHLRCRRPRRCTIDARAEQPQAYYAARRPPARGVATAATGEGAEADPSAHVPRGDAAAFRQATKWDVPGLAWTAALDLGLSGRARLAAALLCWLPLIENLAAHVLAKDVYCAPDRTSFALVDHDRGDRMRPKR
ncbi:MAG: hypothetical protein Q7T71_15595, partial [Herbiconiux sp.]|nr:hypothetical protein [Herbiconiux sp.]